LPKIVEKIHIKTKTNFSHSINSMIAEKAFDLWQKKNRKMTENEETNKLCFRFFF